MRKNRLLVSLVLTLCAGAVACGGADEGLNDTASSLRRGQAGDGGRAVGRSDDSDEATEEALEHDGGKRHVSRGDAGRGDRDAFDHGDGGDCDRGRQERDSDDDDDDGDHSHKQDDRGGKSHGDGGVRLGFDGGAHR